LSTTFSVTFPGGKEYQVGGRPLCSDDKLSELFPELGKALADNKLTEDDSPEDIDRMNNQVKAIVQHFNSDENLDKFIADVYSYKECINVWNGLAEMNGKKKTIEKV